MLDISLHNLQEARIVLHGKAMVTPVVTTNNNRTVHGNPIALKAENLQPGGSFKIRGATYSLSHLTPAQCAAGVVAYSTGNHAQAVALAARQLGVAAIIVMSPDVPEMKIAATRSYGAKVIMAASSSSARRQVAEELAVREGCTLIPPYDHIDVITGQGTIGPELLEQIHPAAIFVPIGGGGLIAGIAAAVKQLSPDVSLIGVEPEWENDAWQSFQQGQHIALSKSSQSIADAIRVQTLGELTYPLIRRYVDDIVMVSEAEIATATLTILEQTHLVVEPSGALAFAAALTYPSPFPSNRPVICIASGGNVTLEDLYRLQRQRLSNEVE
jgi:threonine dehydratase